MSTAAELRQQILSLVKTYWETQFAPAEFVPGQSPVPVSGRVFDADELQRLVDSSLDFWLTTGRFADEFERRLSKWVGVRSSSLVNSGSSANLLAVACLTSPTLEDRALRPGDEVITVASGFPTTVNPLLQHGLVPVFVDVTLPTYNVNVDELEAAIGPRTRAVFLAHTLGNPFELDRVAALCEKHNLWLIEDCCDALGTTYQGRRAGTWGDLATLSFYPAHHITMGEGGAVLTQRPQLRKLIESFRDWGRDCWCAPGKDNTCGKRFDWSLGDMPHGYDHKYIYSHIGYNLKATDMQAAVGCAQLDKLDGFIAARKQNFAHLRHGLADLEDALLLPEATPGSDPSWFGFPLAVRPESGRSRNDLVRHLTARGIGTRLLFGGNLLRQPAYKNIHCRRASDFRIADYITDNVFWIGVYPGLTPVMLDFVTDTIRQWFRGGGG